LPFWVGVQSFWSGRIETVAVGLLHQLHFARLQLLAQGVHVDAGRLCLGQDAVIRLLLLGDVMLDVL